MQIPSHDLLSRYQWKNRILIIFSQEQDDEHYHQQMQELLGQEKALSERDLVLFHVFSDRVLLPDQSYAGQAEAQSLRLHFFISEKETVVLLLGKDGTEKLRSRDILTAERLMLTIDAMPTRQRELGERQRP